MILKFYHRSKNAKTIKNKTIIVVLKNTNIKMCKNILKIKISVVLFKREKAMTRMR